MNKINMIPKECSNQPPEILSQGNNSSKTAAEELTNQPSIPKAYEKAMSGHITYFKLISINNFRVKIFLKNKEKVNIQRTSKPTRSAIG